MRAANAREGEVGSERVGTKVRKARRYFGEKFRPKRDKLAAERGNVISREARVKTSGVRAHLKFLKRASRATARINVENS